MKPILYNKINLLLALALEYISISSQNTKTHRLQVSVLGESFYINWLIKEKRHRLIGNFNFSIIISFIIVIIVIEQ